MTPELLNTPGIYYAVSYWMSCMVFVLIYPNRFKKIKLYVIQAVFFTGLIGFMEVTDGVADMLFVPSMVIIWVILLFIIYTSCDFSFRQAIYYCVRAFIAGEFVASLGWQIYYFSLQNWENSLSVPINLIVLFIIYVSTYTLIYFIEKKYYKEIKNLNISSKEVMTVLIISIIVFALSNISYVYTNTPFSARYSSDIFNIRTLVDFGGIALLMAYHIQITEIQMKIEVENLEKLLEMQYANYKISLMSIEMVNQKYHDLKHQIAVLKKAINSDDAIKYLDKMEKEIKVYEAQNKTGNKILDTVLTSKSIYCQGKGINLTCVADGAALEIMDSIDVSILFGNILDNAIESVVKITDIQRRLIHLTVARQKGFLRIRVENCYEGELKYLNGIPVTTKKGKLNHGYGLKSIQNIVKKYGGSVTFDTKDYWFEIRILIPLPEENKKIIAN